MKFIIQRHLLGGFRQLAEVVQEAEICGKRGGQPAGEREGNNLHSLEDVGTENDSARP